MTTNTPSTQSDKTRKTLDLSPEARAALKLPLHAQTLGHFHDAAGNYLGYIWPERCQAEIAAFIAALVNEALTPAAPALRICGYYECDQIALADSDYCEAHQAEYDDFVLAQISAPVVTVIPDSNLELAQLVTNEIEAAEWPGVPMCADPECLNGADPATGGGYCMQHTVARWTAEETLRREG